jgi:hypothetical protein
MGTRRTLVDHLEYTVGADAVLGLLARDRLAAARLARDDSQ